MWMHIRSGRTSVSRFDYKSLKFGERINYRSPIHPMLKTECVFVRHEGDRAVVLFAHAEKVARVDYEQIELFCELRGRK